MMAAEDTGIPIREMFVVGVGDRGWEWWKEGNFFSIRVTDKTHWRGSRLQSKLADALSQYRGLLKLL